MTRVLLVVLLLAQTSVAAWALSQEAKEHLQAGALAEKQKNFAVAIAEFRAVTKLEPAETIGYIRFANALMENHQYGEAIAPLKAALTQSPDLPIAHQLLGYALLAQGSAAEAIPHLDKVHELGGLGLAQLQTGRASDAVTNLQAALTRTPNDPDLLYYLSQASEMLSQQSLDILLSAHPDSARAFQAKAHNFYVLHELPQAEQQYHQALVLRPDIPGLHLELGQVYAAGSQWEKAEEEFLTETKLQPENAEAAYRLGDARLQQGKLHDALTELQRADQLRPDMSETLYSLGKASLLSNDIDSAERALSRVVVLEKESPLAGQAHYLLASVYRKKGKTVEAERELNEFHRLETANKAP